MKLYFARHGQTNYNQQGLCNADPSVDVHITVLGAEQSKALAYKLREVPLERIFVSELERTQQTAAIIQTFRDVPIKIAPLLNDHRTGYEGQSFKLLMEALDAADDKWTARFNGGESIEDMKARVASFLDELRVEPYDSVLVVTSHWIILAAMAIILNIPNEEAWKIDVVQGSYLEMKL